MAKKKTVQKGSKLRGLQIVFYVCLSILLIVSALFGVGCLFLQHILQGSVVLVADVVLLLFLIELIRMDRKANKKDAAVTVGNVLTDIKDVSVKWSDGARDFATVVLCERGVAIQCEKYTKSVLWEGVRAYESLNDRQLQITYASGESCVVTCNSALKCAAAGTVLQEHVKTLIYEQK